MSCFAIIPWSSRCANDEMFNMGSPLNIDHLLSPYLDMKLEFERMGHEIHTIDLYSSLYDIDYYLFFTADWDIYKKIVSIGRTHRMVYCTAEPPSVCSYNSPKGYTILKHIFPYILTWNDDWVDNKNVYKRNIPYYFADRTTGNYVFKQKKLATCISGNKHSDEPGELYSEREKAISFFEKNHPCDFDLYGIGWDDSIHPSYKGVAQNKADIYHKYRFAICYENFEGLRGWITEKMPDCLSSGIVPIYAGSADVSQYIPKQCYINLRDFSSYEELYDYISTMREDKYQSYLDAAREFVNSSKSVFFSGARYARYILEAIKEPKESYKSSYLAYKVLKWKYMTGR